MQGASLLLLRRDTRCNTSNWGPLTNTLWSILWPFSRALIRHGRSFPLPPSQLSHSWAPLGHPTMTVLSDQRGSFPR